MTNEHMNAPTHAQNKQIEKTLSALDAASAQATAIKNTIGILREALNNSRNMLSQVKEAVGPRSYRFDSKRSWHEDIDAIIASINKALE